MKRLPPAEALIPALIVAVFYLFRDEGPVSFLKKVGGTYVFLVAVICVWIYVAPGELPAAEREEKALLYKVERSGIAKRKREKKREKKKRGNLKRDI